MCLGAIYWARIDHVHFAGSAEQTRTIGFDGAFQYEDFSRPLSERRVAIEQLGRNYGGCPEFRGTSAAAR